MKNRNYLLTLALALVGLGLTVCACIAAPAQGEATIATPPTNTPSGITYPVVDTGQSSCYDDDGAEITCPAEGETFFGQDA